LLFPLFASALVVGVRLSLIPLIGESRPLYLFIMSIMASAYVGGWMSGVIAVALALLADSFLFTWPHFQLVPAATDLPQAMRLLLFAFVGIFAMSFTSALRYALLREAERRSVSQEREKVLQAEMLAHKEAAAALRESVAFNHSILDSSGDCIHVLDIHGRILEMNATSLRVFEIDDFAQYSGRDWITFWPDEAKPDVRAALDAALGSQQGRFQGQCPTTTGIMKWWDVTISPILDEKGLPARLVSTAHDITDSREMEEDLRKSEAEAMMFYQRAEADRVSAEAAKLRAEKAVSTKDNFLAALSHELRTPLTPALLLATELAGDPALSGEIRSDLDVIVKSVTLEARLIDDLLDLTRITSGKMNLDIRPLDAHAALRQTYEIVSAEAHERKIEVKMLLAAQEHSIEADAVRMQQIFWNVLKNAVKFTPPGGTVNVRTSNPVECPGTFLIEIRDTGIGIDPSMIEKIFDAFTQESHEESHRFGGLGLGLAITKRLVNAQDGRISVESAGRGQGSAFYIEMPLERTQVAAPGELQSLPETAAPSIGRHILLVEDHEMTRNAITRLLVRRGHHVTACGTVAEARESAGSFHDLLISDLGLPDGDGHALMAALRREWGLPGIALSGYGMESDVNLSLKNGFFAHLIKPVDIHALEGLIATAPLPGSPEGEPQPEPQAG
jgi:PAS domain S-box-containing protein